MRVKSSVAIGVLFLFSSFLAQATSSKKVLDIQHWTTQKGIPVSFVQTKEIPMLVVQIGFDAGSARDGALPGIAMLVDTMLNDGNAGLTETQMAEGFEGVGADYAHWTNQDMTVFQLKTVTEKDKLDRALNYFTKIFQPDFPAKAFAREKAQQKIIISRQDESPETVAKKAFFAAIYPNHPYGHPILGTEASVKKIQLQNLKSFYRQYYVAPNAMISIAGAVDLEAAKTIAEAITQYIPMGKKATPLPQAPEITQAFQKNIPYPSTQTIACLGQSGITYHDPDYFPLILGNYTLGGDTLISQLGNEIRQKRGLTYGINSTFEPLAATGPFGIFFATRTEKAPEALKVTQETLKQFLKNGPSAKELTAAKRFMRGNFPLRFATNADIANILFIIEFYGLPLDRLDTYLDKMNAVTAEQIKNAFQKHIHPEKMVTITVGK